ncbi:hypothetical protein GALL_512370 [mine drainage metagenome]|uniref:Uncharacterized protein n=1 Tax=mine drainage metagenome TaxID=410659 RepID=A0A1J5P7K2_9ZZZZ
MNIDRAPVQGAQVAKLLHLLQQFDDAPGFLDDQDGQLSVLGIGVHRDQLCSTGNPGERVLDFVGQHLCHADRRFGGRIDVHRAAHAVGNIARGDQQQDDLWSVVQGGELDVALDRRAVAGAHIHVIDKQRRLVLPHADKGLVQRRVNRKTVKSRRTAQAFGGGVEKGFRRRVGIHDAVVRADQERGNRKRRPDDAWGRNGHAATLAVSRKARRIRRWISLGAVEVRIAWRRAMSPAAASRYQPRCLRAVRRPRSTP